MQVMTQTDLTLRLPPEWERQAGVMLTWPHENTIWADTLEKVEPILIQIVKEISLREKVIIVCGSETHHQHILHLFTHHLINIQQVRIYIANSDDIWVRDHGPLTVCQDNRFFLLDFIFNGWGNKYPSENDNAITRAIYHADAFPNAELVSVDFVLEGGAIEVDGFGTLLTTEKCLLSRHSHLSKEDIEKKLKYYFGVNRILWLKHGALSGDDTDSHIDTLARFIDPYTICYVKCDEPTDSHYDELCQMEKELTQFVNFEGNPYHLIALPWPKARYADYDGRRLPLTYANFLIINDAVLVPCYDDISDQIALDIFRKCFPDREIIGIPSVSIIQWYGSLHCMTMQLPEGIVL